MLHEDESPRRPELPKYVRIAGTIWLALLIAVVMGALLTPHMGRIIDFVMLRTSHRQWTAIRLQPDAVYFDHSMPIRTVQSYYSALYRVSASDMEALTDGALREQMRHRMQDREAAKNVAVYRSFARVTEEADSRAVVEEKFHLFWSQGLRFVLHDVAEGWRVVEVTSLP
ncbi:hypothetical protein [Candidatus Entotheonella palauensis]|nr:hypothetical protein [Candidatus Entotheonella palauensis]